MTHYEILEIKENATADEVKQAYRRLIKKYPPETQPEQFKKIREAYDVLSNAKTRQEYDVMSRYGDEINQLYEDGYRFMDEDKFREAAECFKRILIIEPSLNNARNQLGLALSYAQEDEKALVQFRKLIELDPTNATFHSNLAHVLSDLKRYAEALTYATRARELDKENINIVILIADLHHDLKRDDRAIAVLEDAIKQLPRNDFRQFMYLFKMLKIELFERNEASINRIFKRIDQLLEHHQDEKAYVAHQYAAFAFDLSEYKLYDLAKYFTKRAAALDPSRKELADFNLEIERQNKLSDEYERLKDDGQILEVMRYMYALYMFGDELSEADEKRRFDDAFEALNTWVRNEPNAVINSVARIRTTYPKLYEVRKSLWIEAEQVSRSNIRNSSSCFVATVAYGTPLNEELDLLRSWRDSVLRKYTFGRIFIRYYYRYGPALARWVDRSETVKRWTRVGLSYFLRHISQKS
jgi:preprotein translocase subunit SecA